MTWTRQRFLTAVLVGVVGIAACVAPIPVPVPPPSPVPPPPGVPMAKLLVWDADSVTFTTPSGDGTLYEANSTLVTSEKTEGTGSLQIVMSNTQTTQGMDHPSDPQTAPHNGEWIYFRWWMKIHADFDLGTAIKTIKFMRIKQESQDPPVPITVYLRAAAIEIGECPQCNPSPPMANITYDFVPSRNTDVQNWQEYIWGIKRQTSSVANDGEVKFWVNNVLQGSHTGLHFYDGTEDWVASGVMGTFAFPQFNTAGAGGTMWLDDVDVDTDFNSNFAGGMKVGAGLRIGQL